MKVEYDIPVPNRMGEKPIAERKYIEDFISKESKTMAIKYDTIKEADARTTSIRNWLQKNKLNIKCLKRVDTVFLIKPEEEL